MRRAISVFLTCALCLCLFGCGERSQAESSGAENTQIEIHESENTEHTNDKIQEAVEDDGGVEKIIGDWFGQTEIHSDYNDGTFNAVLSINSNNTWASCVNGDFNWGTWESASEKGNRIVLTVQYEGTDRTNEWSFEKHPDGYYYEYVYMETIEFKMSKMESEPADQVYNDWYGEITYKDEYDEEEEEAKASLAISSDGTWSSSVNGSNNNGNIRYVSESGHLAILDVVYEGVERTNQWGVVKKPDGQLYYEYYYGQLIEIPVDPL